MQIEDNLLSIFNCIFKNRENWKHVTDTQKEKYFFIMNRLFSKKFPEKSQLLNNKLIDSVSAMDTWYLFFLDKPYPKWFWSKSSSKTKSEIDDKDILNLMVEYDLKKEDIEILIRINPDLVKENIKYHKNVQNSK